MTTSPASAKQSHRVLYDAEPYRFADYSKNYFESTTETLVGLYSRRDEEGQPYEGVNGIVHRVAWANAVAELKYVLTPRELIDCSITKALSNPTVRAWAKVVAEHIGNQKFWPNTPASINSDPEISLLVLKYWAYGVEAGLEEKEIWLSSDKLRKGHLNELSEHCAEMAKIARLVKGKGCLAACGVAYIEDTLDGIQKTAKIEALAAKAAMGMGLNTSTLRPWSSILSGGAAASGPDRFYGKTISQSVEAVAQGGRRGGALIELRNSNHPDLCIFLEKKRLIPKPDLAQICLELDKTRKAPVNRADKQKQLEEALEIYGKRYHAYLDRQGYLRNTNVSVLVMPGFMEAVKQKKFYQTEFQGKVWDGPVYDPRRPWGSVDNPVVNKLTKEIMYCEYSVPLTEYPEAEAKALALGGEVQISMADDSRHAYVKGHFYAPEIFDRIVENACSSGEPGIVHYDLVNHANANPHVYDINVCNPCFAPGTYVLTRQGHFRIEELVGKSVEIWNGKRWVEVDNFRVTALNQPLIDVELYSGQHLKVTPYHTFILESGTRVKAYKLRPGFKLKTHDLQVQGRHKEKGAYLKGFLVGDGGLTSGGNPELWLYDGKYMCIPRLTSAALDLPITTKATNIVNEVGFQGFPSNQKDRQAAAPARNQIEHFTRTIMTGLSARRESVDAWCSAYKSMLPLDEMLNWSLQSKADFIAGLFDSDGSFGDTKNGFMYQLSSVSKNLLEQVQLVLKSFGIESKLGLMHKAGTKDFGSRGGLCAVQDSWRITVSQQMSIKLASIVKFERLPDFSGRKVGRCPESRWSEIKEIKAAGVAELVYCCTEEDNHAFSLSQGIVSAQCGEQVMYAGPGKGFEHSSTLFMSVCNLTSMHAAHRSFWNSDGTYNYQAMELVAGVMQRFMDNATDVTWFPIPEQNMTARMERRNGGGFAGVAEYLSLLGLEFGSIDALKYTEDLYRLYGIASVKASEDLAETRGCYPLWKGSEYEKAGISVRNTTTTNNAPTGTLAQAMQTTWGVDPHNGIVFSRKVRSRFVDFVAPGFKEMMKRYDAWPSTEGEQEVLMKKIRANNKSCRGLKEIPGAVQKAFPVRVEVEPEAYIRHLAAVTRGAAHDCRWSFNSISNTCSIPIGTSKKFVHDATLLAYELGVKALTFYPDGSRLSQPVEQIAADKTEKKDLLTVLGFQEQKEIDVAETMGVTYKIRVGAPDGGATLHVSLNHNNPGELLEVYARMGKPGAIESGLFEAIGRLVSAFLQYAARFGESERRKVEQIIIKQLINIQSGWPTFFKFLGAEKSIVIQSPCDGLARAMLAYRKQYNGESKPEVKQETAAPKDKVAESFPNNGPICSQCYESSWTKADGCLICDGCGFSKCS